MHHLHASISSPSVCCFCICMSEAPEHILISRFHISVLPAAPSLAVQPRLSVLTARARQQQQIWTHTQKSLSKRILTPACKFPCAANTWVCLWMQLCMHLCSWITQFPPRWSWHFCHLLLDRRTAQPDQSHVRHQRLSGWAHIQFSELIKCFPSLILYCISEWKEKIYRSFSCPRRKGAWIIYCAY